MKRDPAAIIRYYTKDRGKDLAYVRKIAIGMGNSLLLAEVQKQYAEQEFLR